MPATGGGTTTETTDKVQGTSRAGQQARSGRGAGALLKVWAHGEPWGRLRRGHTGGGRGA